MMTKLLFSLCIALFIAFPATKAFNLRSDGSDSRVQTAQNVMKGPGTSDKSATGSSSDDSESTSSETGRAEPTEEANKWLTPAEKLVKDDKLVAQSLQAKYEQMTKEQNNIRAMLEARLKNSESGDKNLINKLVAEASQKAFERYKSEIAKHIDVIYERIRPKIEETCVNLGFQKPSPKMDSPTGGATGGAVDKKAMENPATGGTGTESRSDNQPAKDGQNGGEKSNDNEGHKESEQ